jgi:hypothetical protein
LNWLPHFMQLLVWGITDVINHLKISLLNAFILLTSVDSFVRRNYITFYLCILHRYRFYMLWLSYLLEWIALLVLFRGLLLNPQHLVSIQEEITNCVCNNTVQAVAVCGLRGRLAKGQLSASGLYSL